MSVLEWVLTVLGCWVALSVVTLTVWVVTAIIVQNGRDRRLRMAAQVVNVLDLLDEPLDLSLWDDFDRTGDKKPDVP